ncbi:MAG: hypothetical protein DDT29_02355 [Dehalococcoidia bacterium]|nr:hypothetical protein [Bacillota bacterium]
MELTREEIKERIADLKERQQDLVWNLVLPRTREEIRMKVADLQEEIEILEEEQQALMSTTTWYKLVTDPSLNMADWEIEEQYQRMERYGIWDSQRRWWTSDSRNLSDRRLLEARIDREGFIIQEISHVNPDENRG